ncbi:uncharacterized protein LOC127356108 isoform X4 [Dicentrarchus labrax]|uniref:uncharacterized protein LOC127356108 isoform X4 n=1 Tax=Dicentrarchus labrax TaxID=13489 RepID=UPI0021F5A6BA|nr:uncharacterized protein LOC127356108 isoform X4 [Dicentrarchus labrax]
MEISDFVQDKLTEWGFSEFIQRFEDEGIDKETFLSLGELGRINVLIPKIGPRVKFRKRLKEYLQWNSRETCDFVRDKLTEWDLTELIQRFEDEGIDKETFLSLEESGNLTELIPKTGPRVKFRKRFREYLQALKGRHTETPETMMDTETDTNSDQDDDPEMDSTIFPWHFEFTSTPDADRDSDIREEPTSNSNLSTGLLAVILFILRHHLTTATSFTLTLPPHSLHQQVYWHCHPSTPSLPPSVYWNPY